MDFTKEQLSELICKHTRKKTGYAESTSKCNTRQNYNKSLKNSSLGVEKFNFPGTWADGHSCSAISSGVLHVMPLQTASGL